jgi:hypothetical protein
MTIEEFSALPPDEKTNYMWDHGVCLGQRLYPERFIICVFQIDDFFVEARYSKNNNRVNLIRPIAEVAVWEAYVDRTLRQLVQLS